RVRRAAPSHTPFPYTPLFRSWLLLPLLSAGCASPWWNSFLDPSQVGNFRESNIVNEIQQTISFRDTPPGVAGATDPTPEDLVQTDRKSTRLNSSHVKISYAVF